MNQDFISINLSFPLPFLLLPLLPSFLLSISPSSSLHLSISAIQPPPPIRSHVSTVLCVMGPGSQRQESSSITKAAGGSYGNGETWLTADKTLFTKTGKGPDRLQGKSWSKSLPIRVGFRGLQPPHRLGTASWVSHTIPPLPTSWRKLSHEMWPHCDVESGFWKGFGDGARHWKKPWWWAGLKAGGEGDDRGWDGWMASPTQWTWVWVNSMEAWCATVHEVAKSQAPLRDWTELIMNIVGVILKIFKLKFNFYDILSIPSFKNSIERYIEKYDSLILLLNIPKFYSLLSVIS